MENREFYEVMKEVGDFIGIRKIGDKIIYPFNYIFYYLNMPEDSYLADYDEKCDYRQIFLSWYYDLCFDNNQLDYEGNSSATRASIEEEVKAYTLLKERENLKKYCVGVYTVSDFNNLRKKYNLVSGIVKE